MTHTQTQQSDVDGKSYDDMRLPELRAHAKAYVASGRRLYRMRRADLIAALRQEDIRNDAEIVVREATTHAERVAAILALPLHGQYDGLTVIERSFPKEIGDSPAVLEACATGDRVALLRAMGPATTILLTADGGRADYRFWCACPLTPDEYLRYERWTAEGRVAHGYVCCTCRRLVQTG